MVSIVIVILTLSMIIVPSLIKSHITKDDIGMVWSYQGWIDGKTCVKVKGLMEDSNWDDNFLCFDRDYGVRFSPNGPLNNMNCTRIDEPEDWYGWRNSYLCVPQDNPWTFAFSSNGDMPDFECVIMHEPGDKHSSRGFSWSDNYICIQGEYGISPNVNNTITVSQLGMRWFSNGPSTRRTCVQIHEHNDPHGWDNNYVCFNKDYGVRYSSHGSINGMECVKLTEPQDTHGWADNFLCVPAGNPWRFLWSEDHGIDGRSCIVIIEVNETSTSGWGVRENARYSNYLCVEGSLGARDSATASNQAQQVNSAEQIAKYHNGFLVIPVLVLIKLMR